MSPSTCRTVSTKAKSMYPQCGAGYVGARPCMHLHLWELIVEIQRFGRILAGERLTSTSLTTLTVLGPK